MTSTTKTIIQISRADWAPHIEAAARRFAQVCAFVFVAGWALGTIVHRLNDRLTHLLVRKRRPLALPPAREPQPVFAIAPVPVRCGIQRMAAETAAPANQAPPAGWMHISDPMRRAIRMVRNDGRSQRLAAHLCGVSRSSLQRALKAA
jgi:DNA-directed RNA polymerase specialized sigma24 family protein